MYVDREQIYDALFQLIGQAPGINLKARRLRHWADVPDSQQPALFMLQRNETPLQVTNMPPRWKLNVELYLYAKTQDINEAPSAILNPIIDYVDRALAPINGMENQTLGGLVHYCRISGALQTDEGLLGDQAVVIIPVEIMVP